MIFYVQNPVMHVALFNHPWFCLTISQQAPLLQSATSTMTTSA
jgi:hypothetical protein